MPQAVICIFLHRLAVAIGVKCQEIGIIAKSFEHLCHNGKFIARRFEILQAVDVVSRHFVHSAKRTKQFCLRGVAFYFLKIELVFFFFLLIKTK